MQLSFRATLNDISCNEDDIREDILVFSRKLASSRDYSWKFSLNLTVVVSSSYVWYYDNKNV